MTKKLVTITEERNVCDFCGDERKPTYRPCPICGKVACWDCREKHFSERISRLGILSSDDEFCNECIMNPPEKFIRLMKLYDAMDRLKAETNTFYESLHRRQSKIEGRIRDEKRKVLR